MFSSGQRLGVVFSAFTVMGCSNTVVGPDAGLPTDPGVASDATPPEGQYLLDFTGSESGGLWLGGFLNVAFSIDLKQPTRKFTFSKLDGQTGPGLISSYDYTGCAGKNTTLVEDAVKKLEDGESARVEIVEIEMLQNIQEEPTLKGVCFGYREPGGAWHWNFDVTSWTYDPGTERYHAKIPIHQGPIDALKIVFDASPSHRVTTIAFDAQPAPSAGP